MSLLLPDIETAEGRRIAVNRGLYGGLVITLIALAAPPPLGALSTMVFTAITLGIYLHQPWAARAGVIAAFAPLVTTMQIPDGSLLFGAFFQCFIAAYFFFNAWRGLKPQSGALAWLAAVGWLALALGFVTLCYQTANRYQLPAGPTPVGFAPGDWILIEPAPNPHPGDVVLVAGPDQATPPTLHRVTAGEQPDPKTLLGRTRWIVWSDTTVPTDSPFSYYTKARWGRFPQRVN